jgi:hypothetical protein
MKYPETFPQAEFQDVIKTFITRAFASNRAGFANDLWTIQGYAQEQLIGNPTNSVGFQAFRDEPVAADAACPTDEEFVEHLQAAVDHRSQPNQAMAAGVINWGAIALKALTLLLQLLAGKTPVNPGFQSSAPAEKSIEEPPSTEAKDESGNPPA